MRRKGEKFLVFGRLAVDGAVWDLVSGMALDGTLKGCFLNGLDREKGCVYE